MVVRLPTRKLEKAQIIVQTTIEKNSLSLHELQVITGYLNFVAVVVPLGRILLRRLYNMELYFPTHGRNPQLRISQEARKDLSW